ncbi:hypothetical protein BD560DRAFT_444446 [Blakeslea trispora]|nr:hypothetical protein BD560DRAFT_444446 [Blakeslea trispora]
MRLLSLVSIALALAASANAAVVEERAISSNVKQCVADMTTAEAQLDTVKGNVDKFTSAAGYAGALSVHNSEQALETNLGTAITSCCKQKVAVTEEEAVAVFKTIDGLVPKIENTLASLVSKKPDFANILLALNIVKTDVKNLDTKTASLTACLVAAAPSNYADRAKTYTTKVNAAFAAAKAAYGV